MFVGSEESKKGQWRHKKHENVKVAESVECFISHAKDAKVDTLITTVVRTKRCTTEGSLDENVVSGTATPMNSDCESHLLLSNIQWICWLSPQWLQKEFFIILLYWSSPPPFCTFFFSLTRANGSLVTESKAAIGSLVSAQWRQMQWENSADVHCCRLGIGTEPFVKTNMVGAVVSSPIGPMDLQE